MHSLERDSCMDRSQDGKEPDFYNCYETTHFDGSEMAAEKSMEGVDQKLRVCGQWHAELLIT